MHLNTHVLLVLTLVAACVAIAVKWIRLPYSIALVVAGLMIGVFHLLPEVHMTPEIILMVFLPALLFEASWNLNLHVLKKCYKPVLAFATIGVFISTIVVGYVIHFLAQVDLLIALMFGAMISATDPISVLAFFKKMGIEKRLVTILEGESLLNDGTAVVLFRILMASAIAGGALSPTDILVQFTLVTFGGVGLGIAVGAFASWLTRFFDDHLLEITLTIVSAYGAFVGAEHFHVSGVMAVLVAGIIMGNYGSRTHMSPTTRLAVDSFWEYAAFIAESLVFLLIGLQIEINLLIKYAPQIGVAIIAILAGRFVVIYGLAPFVSTAKYPIPGSWRHLLFWGGLRGSLCMAMALSLPSNFPMRESLMVTTFGVALFTLFVQGLSFEPLVNLLKVSKAKTSDLKYLALNEELKQYRLQLERLQSAKMRKEDYLKEKQSLEHKIAEAEMLVFKLREEDISVADIERIQIERALIQAQRDCLNLLARQDKVSKASLEDFRHRIDEKYEALKRDTMARSTDSADAKAVEDLLVAPDDEASANIETVQGSATDGAIEDGPAVNVALDPSKPSEKS
ncbi:Na+/H+ antiporter [Candidatus Obscuribacterales bacterium]|nr:Na+/H+ antiporter [Candidatus Obscuribacterales bacterium]